MKIIMLTFKYPPCTGSISDYVYFLAKGLIDLGHEIHLITIENNMCPIKEDQNGIFIARVKASFPYTEDYTKWVLQVNFSMLEECIRIIEKYGKPDLIHAHDWHTSFAAKTIKWAYNIPLVCNVHSTEFERNGSINTDSRRFISSTEWTLVYEAKKIIVSSEYLKSQIKDIYSIPKEKIKCINNEIILDKNISKEVGQIYEGIFL
ncbi:glycogen synthase [Clostridium homopropionicum DSM 5847]|uniref:Glycogen synthase n=1 Tax=Clostridium homopropionicum DSM 5847 TaxID=1121318 RepID=A0A0L6ZE87_9CLOT|nr:glycosyltransferase family 4 protein [Clostridium homopropionicum]KOA21285.1 glycogen synthase [Clostridium homopropionicum DSM 5847]SFG29918.1 Glycosyl transferase 4-like domain-containing protein [Clostridium homopropionicum]